MKVTYPFLFFSIIFLSACQPDSRPTQIEDKKITFANFYLRYLQTEKKVKGEAYFRKGADPVQGTAIDYPNGVFFDGGSMEMKKAVGRKLYRAQRSADFKSTYQFEMNPKGTDSYKYDLNINPIFNFKIKNGVSKSKGIQLTWEGSNLNNEEELVLLFTDNQNRAFNIDIQGPTSSPEVFIDSEKLTKMKYGKGSLYLVRKFKSKEKKSGLHLNAISEYYTSSIDIQVIE